MRRGPSRSPELCCSPCQAWAPPISITWEPAGSAARGSTLDQLNQTSFHKTPRWSLPPLKCKKPRVKRCSSHCSMHPNYLECLLKEKPQIPGPYLSF